MGSDVAAVDPRPAFSVGDRVLINSSVKMYDGHRKEIDVGFYWLILYLCRVKYHFYTIGTVGRYMSEDISFVEVGFKFNPAILTKLNEFSVGQMIRIRNDANTIRSIESKFMQLEIRQIKVVYI